MRQKVAHCNGDYRKLLQAVKACAGNVGESRLPEGDDKDIANQFAMFFSEKITQIRSGLQDYSLYQVSGHCSTSLNEFRTLVEKDARRLIMK